MRIFRRQWLPLLMVAIALFPLSSQLSAAADSIRLATTTSTQNSGLLEQLLPRFQQATGIEVQVIAVGTGKALKMGRDGDVDVVMVHAPEAEQAFINNRSGVDRLQFMYNDFVLLGPADDPAGIAGASSVTGALQQIAAGPYRFISRGDDSGTHKKERSLWRAAGIKPPGDNYLEAGQGMGKVLQMAGELGAYTLADRGTWLSQQGNLPLQLLFAGDPGLNNPYSIIAVNPAVHPDTDYRGARRLIDWICSEPTQQLIDDYRINGQRLFTPLHPDCD